MVSGGPYGLEELAQKVGFGWAIVVLVATPVVWSLPTALDGRRAGRGAAGGGGLLRVGAPRAGAFLGIPGSVAVAGGERLRHGDLPDALRPLPGRLSPALVASPLTIGVLVVAAGAAYNLAGARAVGDGSARMTALLLAPFVVLAALAFFVHLPSAAVAPAPARSTALPTSPAACWSRCGTTWGGTTPRPSPARSSARSEPIRAPSSSRSRSWPSPTSCPLPPCAWRASIPRGGTPERGSTWPARSGVRRSPWRWSWAA